MNYVTVENNVKIAIDDSGPKGAPVIFFLHGWPVNRKMYEYQVNLLLRHGYRCVTMDFRGFGDSDCPRNGYGYDRMAKDVYTVISKLDLHCITLVGFSMGGAIALRYMACYKGYGIKNVAFLAAAAPCFTRRPDFPYGMRKEAVDELIHKSEKDRPKMVADFGKIFFGSHPSDSMRDWMKLLGWQAGGISTILTAESLRDEDLRADMKYVCVPTAIFHGKLDQVCPYELALQLKQGIPQAQLFTFEESGHAVFYDELDHFNTHFLSFINGTR